MGPFIDNTAIVVKDNKYGYIYISGTLVGEIEYYLAKGFQNGLAALVDESGKFVFINTKAEPVIP